MTGDEARIRRLEEEVQRLKKRLESIVHKLGQAAEDAARQQQAASQGGRVLIRCQSVGVVGVSAGADVGTGTIRPLQLIDGTRYLLQPIADGDITWGCVNDTGSATVDNEYLIVAWIDGYFTLIVGDCVTEEFEIAPDPPEE